MLEIRGESRPRDRQARQVDGAERAEGEVSGFAALVGRLTARIGERASDEDPEVLLLDVEPRDDRGIAGLERHGESRSSSCA